MNISEFEDVVGDLNDVDYDLLAAKFIVTPDLKSWSPSADDGDAERPKASCSAEKISSSKNIIAKKCLDSKLNVV